MEKWKVGYTTGVFDLFHVGHLNILRRAKEQCDYLIAGVSTDEVVWEYKHKRPIIPFAERLEIVQAIRYVDEVVAEETMDKKAAWERLQFDVIFHGDDRKGSVRYNKYEEQFEKLGVKVVYFPYTWGTSSTILSEFLHRTLIEGEGNGD
jgi:glycerol-3-phosphate cytidylyltransferase